VVRSRKPFFHSLPGKYLSMATLLTVSVTLLLPYTPLALALELSPLPPSFLLIIGLIVILYVITAELAKRVFYARATF
jgi:Mg2+-importing ATPase